MKIKIKHMLTVSVCLCVWERKSLLVFPWFQGAQGMPGGVGQPGLVGEKVGEDGQKYI